MSDSVLRQVYLLSKIPRYPAYRDTSSLKQMINDRGLYCSTRTIQRDLEALSYAFPLFCEDEIKPYRWSWDKDADGMVAPGMSPVEALTIKLAQDHLRSLLPNSSYRLIKSYFDRARKTLSALEQKNLKKWNKQILFSPRVQPMQPTNIKKKVQVVVYEGLVEEKQIVVNYKGRDSKKTKTYILNPLGLIARSAVHYLICTTAEDKHNPRYLPLHRFTKANKIVQPVEKPRGFLLSQFIKDDNLGFLITDRTLNLEAIFTKASAYHLVETPINNSQVLTNMHDGRVRLKAKLKDSQEMRWWLMGFGASVEVVKPKKLRSEFENMTHKLSRIYRTS